MYPLIEAAELKTHPGSPSHVIINASRISRKAYVKKQSEFIS